jgi:hypothetical protein
LRVDDDPCSRRGGRVAIKDADLVVDQVDVVDRWVERTKRLAQGRIERIDRAIPVGGRVERLAVDRDLDRRLGEELATVALLDQSGVVDDPERRRVIRGVTPDE